MVLICWGISTCIYYLGVRKGRKEADKILGIERHKAKMRIRSQAGRDN